MSRYGIQRHGPKRLIDPEETDCLWSSNANPAGTTEEAIRRAGRKTQSKTSRALRAHQSQALGPEDDHRGPSAAGSTPTSAPSRKRAPPTRCYAEHEHAD